jgi:YD repeat-containing protein
VLRHTTNTANDPDGNITAVLDPGNKTTSYGFDALNQRTSVTDAASNTTTTACDAIGKEGKGDGQAPTKMYS